MNQRTHVAVGVIYNVTKDKVLISKRSKNQHLAGYWEFPGGKVECGESVDVALKRELYEELGITVSKAEAYTSVSHAYTCKTVLLDVWKVAEWSGTPESRENQEFCWVSINELHKYNFPDANKYIIQSILLDPMYVISQESYENYSHLYSVTEDCFASGLKNFQLRLKIDRNKLFQKIVETLSEVARRYDSRIILNGSATDIDKYPVDGIHLNSNELARYENRPISEEYILGASCHNEAELTRAVKINVNYAFLSPVLFTASHPKANAIGWKNFSSLIEGFNFPVYALGGMVPTDLEIAKNHGAYGIAMLGAIWNSGSPGKDIKFSTV
tara:strand:- start:8471 stop:9454 length:984 start_codon:yes stop_codon:yes gene_type:complete